MLSQLSKNSLRLAIYFATIQSKEYIPIRDVADEIGISYYNLSKVAHYLARAGVLDSYPGPTGGFRLGLSPHKCCLLDILEAVEGSHHIDSCVFGFSYCSEDKPCFLHHNWKSANKEIKKVFADRTLAELIGLEEQIQQDV